MPKATLFLLFALTLIATLLFGINVGKRLSFSPNTETPTPSPSLTPTLSPSPSPSICSIADEPCGTGLTGQSLGTCCTGFVCNQSENPDEGGSCIAAPPTKKPTPTKKGTTQKTGTSTYTDSSCGFTFSYPGSYLRSETTNGGSTIYTDQNDNAASIVTACQAEIPKPPLREDLIEDIVLDGVATQLYHDASSKDGSPRDEVIVKHPTSEKEIIIAGYGSAYNAAIASFKFIR